MKGASAQAGSSRPHLCGSKRTITASQPSPSTDNLAAYPRVSEGNDGATFSDRNPVRRNIHLDLVLGKHHLLVRSRHSPTLRELCLDSLEWVEHCQQCYIICNLLSLHLDMKLEVLGNDKVNIGGIHRSLSIVELAAVVGAKVALPLDHTHH